MISQKAVNKDRLDAPHSYDPQIDYPPFNETSLIVGSFKNFKVRIFKIDIIFDQ